MPSKGSSALPIGALLLALGAGCGTPKPTSLATESHMEVMPELSGTDHRGQPYSLREDLGRGPTLVIFYRGHW